MIKRIRVLKDIPGICPAGELVIPSDRVDEKFAQILIGKGLAELLAIHVRFQEVPESPVPVKKKGRR